MTLSEENFIQVLTVNAKLAIFLKRAMVLNHEQDAPPVRTLVFLNMLFKSTEMNIQFM